MVWPFESCVVALLKAISNIHPGVGRASEAVDLPVQRDNLGYPVIYSSSIKGALKSMFWNMPGVSKEIVKTLFGPEPESVDVEKYASSVAVLDANIVALPVRSFQGVYAYATSPFLLKRLDELLELAGETEESIKKLSEANVAQNEVLLSGKAAELLSVPEYNNNVIVNEELSLAPRPGHDQEIMKLEKILNIEQGRLLVLNDNDAHYALERSIVRVARIRLNRETKTVQGTGLWTEEYVPRGSIFSTSFFFSRGRKSDGEGVDDPNNIKQKFKELIDRARGYVIVGGNESIGRGLMKLIFLGRESHEPEKL